MSGAENLRARTFTYASQIMDFCVKLSMRGHVQRRLAGQLFDAATSVGAHLEEATAAQTKADFVAKNYISLKEAREAAFWLRLVVEKQPDLARDARPLLIEANELVAILTALIRRARSNPDRGGAI